MKTQYDLFQIDETRGEDKTGENTENTLTRYFFPDDNKPRKGSQNNYTKLIKITQEKIGKSFRKPIRLRNSLKQCYWDRSCGDIQDYYIIRVEHIMPTLNFTRQIQAEIQNYILNDFYDVYNGRLKWTIDFQNKILNYTGIDVMNSESNCEDMNFYHNLILNPKIVSNKNEINDSYLNIYRNIYMQIKILKEIKNSSGNDTNYLPGLFNFYFHFHRENSKSNLAIENNSNIVVGKIYCVFPNINLELKRINKIPISRSILSKFLVSGGRFDKLEKNEAEQIKNSYSKNGFIAMSSKHRLITLHHNVESMKEILFGIWLNLSEEKINKNTMNEEVINGILIKYSTEIYEKCIHFLIKSKRIEVINSPSPDEGIFLLCLFLNGAQFFYEVKILPNEKEKHFNTNKDSYNEINSALCNFSNEWVIVKNKFYIENNLNRNFNDYNSRMTSRTPFNPKIENISTTIRIDFSNVDNLKTVKEFFCKKFMLMNNKELNRGSKQINNTINTTKTCRIATNTERNKMSSSIMNYKDPLNELFEDEENDKRYMKYNFPLSIPTKINRNPSLNLLSEHQNKSDTTKKEKEKEKVNLPPRCNNKNTKNISSTTRNNPIDTEYMLRENLLTTKTAICSLKKNPNCTNNKINNSNSNNNKLFTQNPNDNTSQTLTITNTSKGFSEQQSLQNISSKPLSAYHRQAQQDPTYFNTIDNDDNIYINHKKHFSNDIGYYTAQNFFPNKKIATFEIDNNNNQINIGKSTHIERTQTNPLNHKNLDANCNENTSSNIQNAYEIIYDQAKSIQLLQEQIVLLKNELNFVVDKLKNQEEKDKNSLICSCGGKKSGDKQNVISTGTNTSIEVQHFSAGFNNFHYENNINRSNSNSMKSNNNNNNMNNASRPSIKNFNNDMDNTANILASHNAQTIDDLRYENFLNENSINFPKQFLDIDLNMRHYESLNREDIVQSSHNMNANMMTGSNSNNKFGNNKSMTNNTNNPHTSNYLKDNQLETEMRNININSNTNYKNYTNINNESDNYIADDGYSQKYLTKEKEKRKNSSATAMYNSNNNKNNVNSYNYNLPTETSNIMSSTTNLRFNLNNVDITTTSIDPPSYRYFLKVPSLHIKSNTSMANDEIIHEKDHFIKKSLDITRGNDYTINLPKIIFNESIESYEENDVE